MEVIMVVAMVADDKFSRNPRNVDSAASSVI